MIELQSIELWSGTMKEFFDVWVASFKFYQILAAYFIDFPLEFSQFQEVFFELAWVFLGLFTDLSFTFLFDSLQLMSGAFLQKNQFREVIEGMWRHQYLRQTLDLCYCSLRTPFHPSHISIDSLEMNQDTDSVYLERLESKSQKLFPVIVGLKKIYDILS